MSNQRTELVTVLRVARDLVARPGNVFTWTLWDDAAAATMEINAYITALEAGYLPPRVDLGVLFAATGPLQEVAMQSGWSSEFLALAERFDAAELVAYKDIPHA